jgi:hypothetical protein
MIFNEHFDLIYGADHMKLINSFIKNIDTQNEVPVYSKRISVIILISKIDANLVSLVDQIVDNVNEIILVSDTKIDKKLISKYSNIILKYNKFINFSKQRNFGISCASNEYVCFLDSDNILSDSFFENITKLIDISEWSTKNVLFAFEIEEHDGNITLYNYRFFKISEEIKFIGYVHEDILVNENIIKVQTNLKIMHYGYDDESLLEMKAARNIKLLNEEINDTGFNKKNCYYMAKNLYFQKKYLLSLLYLEMCFFYFEDFNREGLNSLISYEMIYFEIFDKNSKYISTIEELTIFKN